MAKQRKIKWTKVGDFEHCLPPKFYFGGYSYFLKDLTDKHFSRLLNDGCSQIRKRATPAAGS